MEVNDRTSFRKQLILLTVKYTYVCMVPHGLNMASQPASQGHGPSENGKWKFAQMLIQCWPGDSKSLSVVDN